MRNILYFFAPIYPRRAFETRVSERQLCETGGTEGWKRGRGGGAPGVFDWINKSRWLGHKLNRVLCTKIRIVGGPVKRKPRPSHEQGPSRSVYEKKLAAGSAVSSFGSGVKSSSIVDFILFISSSAS